MKYCELRPNVQFEKCVMHFVMDARSDNPIPGEKLNIRCIFLYTVYYAFKGLTAAFVKVVSTLKIVLHVFTLMLVIKN